MSKGCSRSRYRSTGGHLLDPVHGRAGGATLGADLRVDLGNDGRRRDSRPDRPSAGSRRGGGRRHEAGPGPAEVVSAPAAERGRDPRVAVEREGALGGSHGTLGNDHGRRRHGAQRSPDRLRRPFRPHGPEQRSRRASPHRLAGWCARSGDRCTGSSTRRTSRDRGRPSASASSARSGRRGPERPIRTGERRRFRSILGPGSCRSTEPHTPEPSFSSSVPTEPSWRPRPFCRQDPSCRPG
jgi:hypothetical protein